jgi:hypothetical protein
MAAYDTGKMILFVRSILWDLNIPQEAATLLYEDNDGCTAMGNAQKSTPRTRHIDIKYFSLCEWVERDLILLDRIDTAINMSNHLTKPLQTLLFHQHTDFLSGMYLPVTLLYIPLSLGNTPTTPSMSTNLHLCLSLPHLQPPGLEFMHQLRMIMLTARGCKFLGVVIQSSVPKILFSCLAPSIT